MKCKFCGSEWQSKIEIKTCPFCRKSLAESADFTDIEQTLRFIMDTYSEQIHKTPNRIVAYLGDLAPQLTRERKLLKICADAGVIAELLSITDEGEMALASKRAVALLNSEHFIEPNRAEEAIGWIVAVTTGSAEVGASVRPVGRPSRRGGKKPTVTIPQTQEERIRKRREELKQYAGRIVCSDNHILALRSDGTVIAYGNNEDGQCNVDDWRDVTAIACIDFVSVGLTADREVLCTFPDTDDAIEVIEAYSQWQNIVQIPHNDPTMGLCGDGTVRCLLYDCEGECECADDCTQRKWECSWRKVTAVASAVSAHYGLQADGTVVACGKNKDGLCDVRDWRDVVSIIGGEYAVYGIRKDGRVYARGEDVFGVRNWRDIVDIAPGFHMAYGLKADGSVVSTGIDKTTTANAVHAWKNIVAVDCGIGTVAGLKADGTVVAYGCDTSSWRDIVAIVCGDDYVVGLRKDGTVLFTGKAKYGENKIAGKNLFH